MYVVVYVTIKNKKKQKCASRYRYVNLTIKIYHTPDIRARRKTRKWLSSSQKYSAEIEILWLIVMKLSNSNKVGIERTKEFEGKEGVSENGTHIESEWYPLN